MKCKKLLYFNVPSLLRTTEKKLDVGKAKNEILYKSEIRQMFIKLHLRRYKNLVETFFKSFKSRSLKSVGHCYQFQETIIKCWNKNNF